jgi:hypothetical protein
MHARTELVLGADKYLHWGVIQLSLTNFLIIVGMVVLFAVALVARFPGGNDQDEAGARRVEERHDDDL